MNAARFFELAHKVIGDRATDDERAELAVMMARYPTLKEEMELLRKEARADAKAAGSDPRSQRPAPPELAEDTRWHTEASGRAGDKRFYQRWQWWVRLVIVIVVSSLLILSDYKFAPEPIIQVAMIGETL